MASPDVYDRQVALLVRLLPVIAAEPVFALKGGTAINLFVRDLPRLSVDIDLTYLPVEPRDASLQGIDAALGRIMINIKKSIGGAQVNVQRSGDGHIERLHVQAGVTVKVEVTPVLRGVVFDPVMMAVTDGVEARYGFAETLVVSHADLYAGKLVAAFDRQHPRELFDVKLLLEDEGVGDDLRRAFVVYVLESQKPLNAILDPRRKDIAAKYKQEFRGMSLIEDPGLEALLEVREQMIARLVGEMPEAHRHFLLSFKRGEPDWNLLGSPHVADLPAVRFRIQKLSALPPEARAEQLAKLEAVLAPPAR
jgi:predicted nucleotidyltransferase component of viral defense system